MPRVDNASQEEISERYADLTVSSLQPGKRRNVYSAIGNNLAMLAGFREFFGSLWERSDLSGRQREIAIPGEATTAAGYDALGIAIEDGDTFEGWDPK